MSHFENYLRDEFAHNEMMLRHDVAREKAKPHPNKKIMTPANAHKARQIRKLIDTNRGGILEVNRYQTLIFRRSGDDRPIFNFTIRSGAQVAFASVKPDSFGVNLEFKDETTDPEDSTTERAERDFNDLLQLVAVLQHTMTAWFERDRANTVEIVGADSLPNHVLNCENLNTEKHR